MKKVLIEEWDPIGIKNVPDACDEYDAYVISLIDFLKKSDCEKQVFDFLWQIETQHMGLPGDVSHTRHVTNILINLKEVD